MLAYLMCAQKTVYPFQVPARETVAAYRGSAPRENFRVTTAETDDADNQPAGTGAQENLVAAHGVPASGVDSGEVRPKDTAAERSTI